MQDLFDSGAARSPIPRRRPCQTSRAEVKTLGRGAGRLGQPDARLLGGGATARDWRVNLSRAVLDAGGKLNAHLTA
jgi:hypothetical protein